MLLDPQRNGQLIMGKCCPFIQGWIRAVTPQSRERKWHIWSRHFLPKCALMHSFCVSLSPPPRPPRPSVSPLLQTAVILSREEVEWSWCERLHGCMCFCRGWKEKKANEFTLLHFQAFALSKPLSTKFTLQAHLSWSNLIRYNHVFSPGERYKMSVQQIWTSIFYFFFVYSYSVYLHKPPSKTQ